jgi:hypothetical protein
MRTLDQELIMFAQSQSPQKTSLRWSRVDAADARAERDIKMILSARDFQVLSGSHAVTPCYYRGRDRSGNAITVRVIADEMAA